MTTYLILGASRGVGHAMAKGLPERGDTAYLVSRSLTDGTCECDGVKYISLAADLSEADTLKRISLHLSTHNIQIF